MKKENIISGELITDIDNKKYTGKIDGIEITVHTGNNQLLAIMKSIAKSQGGILHIRAKSWL